MATTAPDQNTIAIEILAKGCELVPLPAAHIVRDGDGFRFEAFNRAYRLSGLGVVADRSPMFAALGDRIDTFLRSEECRLDFDWSFGADVDCRFYRVTLARVSARASERCAMTFLDLTSQIQAERTLRREMTTDSLTGLPNREGFCDLVDGMRAMGHDYAVLVLDLVRFSRINACLSGIAGDELLITVARRIKGALRARDALARIGGDEFGILIEIDEDEAEASDLAARIRRVLANPFRLTDFEIAVECSIGIAIPGISDQDDVDELIRNAQFATKRAKSSGAVEFYQPAQFSIAREEFAMETALRRAIEDRRLRLTYQPICDLATGRIVAFESLARWCDDSGRDHPPTAFIPVAEQSGLIVPLGRWAIEEATRTIALWDAQAGGDCGVKVAVNLSPLQLQRDALVPVVENALAAAGVAGNRLKLELTESALVEDPDRTATTMRALKALGATIALDDFGTGYSNLALLQTLPIDLLKIDRSFVTGMLADRDKIAIVRAILSLAQALGMRTVAEGIETKELAQTLAALGCHHGQGYLFARPQEANAAYAMIAPPPPFAET